METSKHHIEPAAGRLGVLTVGLGAVASTFIAGVELIRRGLAEPVGSLTQMGTIRLGKRTEDRSPLIRDFVPLASLDELVFGAWDPFSDNAYEAAVKCGVLDRYEHIEPIAAELKEHRANAGRLRPELRRAARRARTSSAGTSKRDLAEQIRKDIRDFKAAHYCDRIVMIWCASTEIYHRAWTGPPGPRSASRRRWTRTTRPSPPSMLYAYAALKEGMPFVNGAPNLTVDMPAMVELAHAAGVPIAARTSRPARP